MLPAVNGRPQRREERLDSPRRRLRPRRTTDIVPSMWRLSYRQLSPFPGCRWRAARSLGQPPGDCTHQAKHARARHVACHRATRHDRTGLQAFNEQLRRQDCNAAASNVPSDLARRHRRLGVCPRAFLPSACAQVHGSIAVHRRAGSIRRVVRSTASYRQSYDVSTDSRTASERCPLISPRCGQALSTEQPLRQRPSKFLIAQRRGKCPRTFLILPPHTPRINSPR